MKLDALRLYAQTLLSACDQAEKAGRDELNQDDFAKFAELDDIARADLADAIAKAK